MKNGQPESLAEALLLIKKQKKRISEQEEKILAQQGEIKILNEKLAVKKAREYAAKTERLKKLYELQPFLFDSKFENQCPEISDEDIVQALKDDDLFDKKSEKKKSGRINNKSKNLPRKKYVIDLTEEEKICSNCGTKMVKVREIVSERIEHVPSSEYIEEVHRYVYECPNCLDDNDKPVRKVAKEMEQEHHVLFCPLLKLPSRMVLLLKIISDVFLKKPLMLKLKMTGKNFSPGILKLRHIRFVENGFKLWYNYVNVNSICLYGKTTRKQASSPPQPSSKKATPTSLSSSKVTPTKNSSKPNISAGPAPPHSAPTS